MKQQSDTLTLAIVGIAACCGVSALLTAAVGATLLGVATELWVLVIVGMLVLLALALRAAMRRTR